MYDKRLKNLIDVNTISQQIDDCINDYCNLYGLDLYNYNQRVNVKHNEVNNILLYCYDKLFKPDFKLWNQQTSLLDYENIELLTVVAYKFISICALFNKSLGLMSFSFFTGIDDNTLLRWSSAEGKKANPQRWRLCKSIKENNKNMLISNLKDSPVGMIAVANNDFETGLRWTENNAQQITQSAVYILPSERIDKLKLAKKDHTDDA